jgi:hypothetical protein
VPYSFFDRDGEMQIFPSLEQAADWDLAEGLVP